MRWRGGGAVLCGVCVPRGSGSDVRMSGCGDGIPSRRLTRAVLAECMAGWRNRIRVRAVADPVAGAGGISSQTRSQSVVPFLRTAAQTLRHRLDAESFLDAGRGRVCGGAEFGESDDGGDDGGRIVEPAASLGGFVVGDKFLVEAECRMRWRRRDATWNRCYGK